MRVVVLARVDLFESVSGLIVGGRVGCCVSALQSRHLFYYRFRNSITVCIPFTTIHTHTIHYHIVLRHEVYQSVYRVIQLQCLWEFDVQEMIKECLTNKSGKI